MYINLGGDTETCDGDINCFQIAHSNDDVDIRFTNPAEVEDDFLQYLDDLPRTRGRVYVIWFHNLAFDSAALFPAYHVEFQKEEVAFESHGWSVTGIYAHVVFLTLRKKDKCVMLLDTNAFFKTALKRLAKLFCSDLPKLSAPSGIGSKRFSIRDKLFVQYAKRDAVITRLVGQYISDFHMQFDIPISVSAPHMASKIFRRKFLKQSIPLPSKGVMYAALNAYHGGKNNLAVPPGFYKGVQCIDIKSAYPLAMSLLPSFSNAALYKRFTVKDAQQAEALESVPAFGVFCVSGNAQQTPYPVLFGRGFKPVHGMFQRIWVTGFELNAALNAGVCRLTECYGYFYDAESDTEPSPFAAYVAYFFEKKETTKSKIERELWKLCLNSLYGKFIESRAPSTLLNFHYNVDTNEHFTELTIKGGTLFHPFIAALITGHTRAYIYAMETRFHALHTSTDGIVTKAKRIACSKELGGLSIEGKGDIEICRNKLYILYSRKRSDALMIEDERGRLIPKKSRTRKGYYIVKYALHGFFGSVDLLEEMLKQNVMEYEYTKVNKLRESLRRNLKVNRFETQRRQLNLKGYTYAKT